MNKISMWASHRAYEYNFNSGELKEAEIQQLKDLSYTVELVKQNRDISYYKVGWSKAYNLFTKEERDMVFANNKGSFAINHYSGRE